MKHLLLFFSLVPVLAQANFSDVSETQLNADAIAYLVEQGVISGYEDGTFRPDNPINRAEFTKIIMESQFSPVLIERCDKAQHSFADVADRDWYASHVCLAAQREIVSGYSDDTFRPADNIVFSEAAKIIVETMGYPTESISPWYAPYAQVLSDRRAIPKTMDSPSKAITRGEMAEMIYRLKTDNRTKSGTRFTFTTRAAQAARTNNGNLDTSVGEVQALLELVNQARSERDLAPLSFNSTLSRVAQDYADKMNEEDFFEHVSTDGSTPSERVTAAGYQWRSVAENIAKGQVSAADVFDTWKNSPGHWRNIISPGYEEIGIGQAEIEGNEFYRGFVWVQVFGTELK